MIIRFICGINVNDAKIVFYDKNSQGIFQSGKNKILIPVS